MGESLVNSLIADFKRNHLWGTLVFQFQDGELVFWKREDTHKLYPDENNSLERRGANGTHHSESSRI